MSSTWKQALLSFFVLCPLVIAGLLAAMTRFAAGKAEWWLHVAVTKLDKYHDSLGNSK